jgi:hypothetical protein
MQTAPHREAWYPITAEERRLVMNALEEVLVSALFRSSRRYPAMLRYIVEKTLDGHQDSLKERTIGVEVFGRDPAYDTNEDPVVRFTASEIRKRVAQFYRENGSNSAIEFHLPLGTYIPQFLHGVESIEAAEERAEIYPSLPASSSAVNPILPTKRLVPGFVLGAILVVVFVIVLTAVSNGFRNQNPVIDVWSPLLKNPNPVLISAGRPRTPTNQILEPPDISIEDHILRPEFRLSITTVDAIANIAGFLQIQKKPFRIHDADSNSLADFHGRPVVLVNANDNKWTLLLLKPLRFQFTSEGNFSYVKDATQPGFRGWSVNFREPFHSQTTDYAIVARFNCATTGSPIIVVAGISSNGTEAAGEFIVAPERLSELVRSAPPQWKDGNFEAVLKVEVVDGNTGSSTIVASEFW